MCAVFDGEIAVDHSQFYVMSAASDVAAYWHDHVADLPPADEVARRAIEDRRAMGVADPEPHSTA